MKKFWVVLGLVLGLQMAAGAFTIYDSGTPVIKKFPYPGKVFIAIIGNEVEIGVPWSYEQDAPLVAIHVRSPKNKFITMWENPEIGNELGVPAGIPMGLKGRYFWYRVPRVVLKPGCYQLIMVRSAHQGGSSVLITRAYPFCL